MEQNPQSVQQPTITSQPVQSQAPVNPASVGPDKHSMKLTFVLIGVLILLVLGLSSYAYFSLYSKPKDLATTQNIVPTRTLSPTPTVYTLNPSDTSDNAINQDANVVNRDLDNLNSDVNNVNQSFSDQQPNLQ